MTWMVEHHFTYGWDDAGWHEDVAGQGTRPSRFSSQAEAEQAIDTFIADTVEAARAGDLEDEYRREDFRAVEAA